MYSSGKIGKYNQWSLQFSKPAHSYLSYMLLSWELTESESPCRPGSPAANQASSFSEPDHRLCQDPNLLFNYNFVESIL